MFMECLDTDVILMEFHDNLAHLPRHSLYEEEEEKDAKEGGEGGGRRGGF